jgi:hypothetical protein
MERTWRFLYSVRVNGKDGEWGGKEEGVLCSLDGGTEEGVEGDEVCGCHVWTVGIPCHEGDAFVVVCADDCWLLLFSMYFQWWLEEENIPL